MICLRCGYCCINSDVIIVKKGVMEIPGDVPVDELDKYLEHKPSGVACPYLSFEGTVASCEIHDLEVYKDSPCDRHGQIEGKGAKCRMGRFVLERNLLIMKKNGIGG